VSHHPAPVLFTRASSFRLDGRVVLVTGASAGIGSWLAAGLSDAGAHLVLTARSGETLRLVASRLPDAVAVPGDVTDDDHRARLVSTTLDRFGRIDGLVNNAGRLQVTTAFREDAAAFREMLELNLLAPYDLARRCASAMRDTGGGSIVNVTSMSAILATAATGVPSAGYCAAKAGLAHLTRELASQWGRHGIRVNAVAPGMFPTAMIGHVEEPPEFFLQRLVLPRAGKPAEMVAAVQYLLSDAAGYVTGQQIAVDGGRTIT
jgi:NAD(P)-dependent dehydrogenase (short-subunit alcohol dehydrogenase family)